MLNLITGGAGTGKSALLADRIEAAGANGENVAVVIPDQFSFEYDRLLYKRLGAEKFNAVSVLSFSRLASDIFIRHGRERGKYADDTAKTVLMFLALQKVSEREKLTFYTKQACANAISPRFAGSVLSAIKELVMSGISPEALADKLTLLGGGARAKAADIALIYSEYNKTLAELGFKDGLGDISEAAEKAALNGYFTDTRVFIDEFKSFTEDERKLIDVMLADARSVDICLTTEDGRAAEFSVFAPVNKTRNGLVLSAKDCGGAVNETRLDEKVRFKSPALAFLSANILRPRIGVYDAECESVRIFEASDVYNEADYVCSQISRLTREQGYKYGEIAVVSRRLDACAATFESAFARYGIPFYSNENTGVTHKELIIFILTALKLAGGGNADGGDWLKFVKSRYSPLDETESDLLEKYCHTWNVTAKMWREPFIDGDAEILRVKAAEPIFRLKAACSGVTGAKICEAVYRFFEEIGLVAQISAQIGAPAGVDGGDAALLAAAREYKQLWELLRRLLETLHKTLCGVEITLPVFARLFEAAAGKLTLSAPPQALDCVSVMPAHLSRLARPKVVFAVGVNDGEFPADFKPEGLFSERDRLALREAGLTLAGDIQSKIADERFIVYSILSAPSELLYITYPLADARGGALYPSVAAAQALKMFGGKIKKTAGDISPLEYCATPQSAYYSYVQNRGAESAVLREALSRLPEYSLKIAALDNIRKKTPRSISAEVSARLFGGSIYVSATSFEDYQKCPYQYFLKSGMKLLPRRKTEISSLSRGNVIHHCLYMLFTETADFRDMTDDGLQNKITNCLDKYYADELRGDYGKTARFRHNYFKIADAVFDVAVRLRGELKQSRFTPREFEYRIGAGGNEPPLTLFPPDGAPVCFVGTADRVDTYESADGKIYVRVVDYKSGNKKFNPQNLLYGLDMQTLIYLFGITDPASKGKYAGCIPAGALYIPSKRAKPSLGRYETEPEDIENLKNKTYKPSGLVLNEDEVIGAMEKDKNGLYTPLKFKKSGELRVDSKELALNAEQLEKLRGYAKRTLVSMARNLRAGEIPALPLAAREPCGYCDYGGVCGHVKDKDKSRPAYKEDEAKRLLFDIINK